MVGQKVDLMTDVTNKLIAYADGQLDRDEIEEVEALLIRYEDQLLHPHQKSEIDDAIDQSPALAAVVDDMRAGQKWFKQVFAPELKPLLDAPASPELRRFVEELTANDAADSQNGNVVPLLPWSWARQKAWYALAASIMMALMIGGWNLHVGVRKDLSEAQGVQAHLEQELERSKADRQRQTALIASLESQVRQRQVVSWTSKVAEYHGLYARQPPRHLVEVPADEQDHIETWLSEQLGGPVSIPDLAEANIDFKGARLLAVNGMPVAQLMYIDADGEPLAFCFMRNMAGLEKSPELSEHNELKLIDWSDQTYQYAIVGATTFATLEALAHSLSES